MRWLALVPLALAPSWLAGCSSPDPWHQPVRFAVLPLAQRNVDGDLRLAAAWIPAGATLSRQVYDATARVPAVGVDVTWSLEELVPPEAAVRLCFEGECDGVSDGVALAWIVAFVDRDRDEAIELVGDEEAPWDAGALSAGEPDELAAIATDHVIAVASQDVVPADPLARSLGWAVPAGASVMRVLREAGRELLEPTTSRERVPLWLAVRERSDAHGLCCGEEALGCSPGLVCPSFAAEP